MYKQIMAPTPVQTLCFTICAYLVSATTAEESHFNGFEKMEEALLIAIAEWENTTGELVVGWPRSRPGGGDLVKSSAKALEVRNAGSTPGMWLRLAASSCNWY